MSTAMLAAARTAALFCAHLPAAPLTRTEATEAIRAAVRSHGGTRGCACDVAQEFGDHPDTALARMVWARAQVAALFGPSEIVWSRPAVAS